MNTTNIVSAEGIVGNVGSCKTEVATVVTSRDSLWTVGIQNIATNSCTGEVTTYNAWQFTDAAGVFSMIGGLGVVWTVTVIVVAVADRISKTRYR